MKQTFLLLLSVTSCCFSQFKFNYKDIQEKYPADSIEVKNGCYVHTKVLKDSLLVRYFFEMKDSLFITVTLDKQGGALSQKEIVAFQNEYIADFKPTRRRDSENVSIGYDEEKELMKFKVFSDYDRKKLIQILFTTEKGMISEMLKLMNLGY